MSSKMVTITLPPEMVALVRTAVGTGDYAGISEVMREALRDWKLKRAQEVAALNRTLAAT
jgi:antitoxin ParD1/3/4